MAAARRTTEASKASKPSKENETAGFIDGIIADKTHEIQEFGKEYAFTAADSDFRSFTADAAAARRRIRFADVKDEYSNLWAEMAIRREKLPEVDSIVERIVRHKEAYRSVERLTRVPWFAIAIIHNLEAGGDFNSHLHNADPLSARTVHVPAGRPRSGNPPFTWEESAVDALEYDGLTQVTDWSTEHLAYLFEGFNGWGYRLYHPPVKSPYLWSFSNHYTKGKYVGDGQWSETAVSRQCGAMVLRKRLQEAGHIRLDIAKVEAPVARTQPASILSAPPTAVGELTIDTFARESAATAVARVAWPVETQLTDGPGIFGYYSPDKRYGTASTIAALYEVGRIWRLRRAAPRVGVGDISLRGGGDIDGHASHETGRDVDLRPMKNDGTEGPVTWKQAKYSHSLTQELIDIIYANGVVMVKVIGFNDPNIQGCVNWVNHDNHLHVRYYFEDEAPGYPLLELGMYNSPPVRECQRRLNNWKQRRGGTDLLAPDGDFGQNTLKAVRDFQAAMGLVVDGKVGNDTWRRTLDYVVDVAIT
jgi:lysozyme family protein